VSIRTTRTSGTSRYVQRAEQVAERARSLVADQYGIDIAPVRIVITNASGLEKTILQADHDLATDGGEVELRPSTPFWESMMDSFAVGSTLGQMALDTRGLLIVINAPKQRGMRDFDETLVHELAHCAQFSGPALREEHRVFVRQKYGIEPRSTAYTRYWGGVYKREAEAVGYEPLARKLPPFAGDDDRAS